MNAQHSPVFLLDCQTNLAVDAELLDEVSESRVLDAEEAWSQARHEGELRLDQLGVPHIQRPQSAHWDWPSKLQRSRGLLAYRAFCILCEGQVQGLMQVATTEVCRIPNQEGRHLVYVKYLETAPWNQPGFIEKPRYAGVGTIMLAAAVELSINEGFRGRFGLHSLPQAERFYESKGMSRLDCDPSEENLMYFEATAEQAHEIGSKS